MNLEQIMSNPDFSVNGLSIDETGQLLGMIQALPAVQRKAALTKISAPALAPNAPTPAPAGRGVNSRNEFIKRMAVLPKDAQESINVTKRAQMVDAHFYATKAANAVNNVKMFLDDDNKVTGLTNISGGKLAKGVHMLCSGIILLSGVDAASVNSCAFDVIPASVRNGEVTFRHDGHLLMPEKTTLEIFNTTNRSNTIKGLYEFESPKMLEAEKPLDMELDFPAALAANTWIRVILVGTAVIPY